MGALIGNSIYLTAGMVIRLTIPVDIDSAQGKFPLNGVHPITGTEVLKNGFAVKFPNVGHLTKITEAAVGVEYHHDEPEKNSIWFFSLTGESGVINVIATPIHDHSSVTQGGPAYGTYFSEYT